ncbi:MAG: ankyrin repeat domain-containing protein [Planctomycetes bacterium]|nr:ankyrin repeat domain-containing protein [Planctomycetota bacterium]
MAQAQEIFAALKAGDLDAFKKQLAGNSALANARNEQGVSLLMQARYDFRQPFIEVILKHRTGLDVFEAAALGKLDKLTKVLDVEPDAVNDWSPDGFQPMHLAAFFAQPDTLRLLLERGGHIGIHSKNPLNVRAIHCAAAGRSLDCVRTLLEKGSDPNARQAGGFTPLHSAAQNGSVEMVKALLSKGAVRSSKTDDGKMAVDFAKEKGHTDVIALLETQP